MLSMTTPSVRCRSCNHRITRYAPLCPACGIQDPGRGWEARNAVGRRFAWVLLGGIILVAAIQGFVQGCNDALQEGARSKADAAVVDAPAE